MHVALLLASGYNGITRDKRNCSNQITKRGKSHHAHVQRKSVQHNNRAQLSSVTRIRNESSKTQSVHNFPRKHKTTSGNHLRANRFSQRSTRSNLSTNTHHDTLSTNTHQGKIMNSLQLITPQAKTTLNLINHCVSPIINGIHILGITAYALGYKTGEWMNAPYNSEMNNAEHVLSEARKALDFTVKYVAIAALYIKKRIDAELLPTPKATKKKTTTPKAKKATTTKKTTTKKATAAKAKKTTTAKKKTTSTKATASKATKKKATAKKPSTTKATATN